MTSPLVSVIVPCYNYGHLLAQTLQSVEAQTEQRWECLIVDDGSTDDTTIIAKSFADRDSRFRLIEIPNSGPSSARNAGLAMACGEYIQFLDADDLLEKRKLELQVKFLESNPEVDLIYGEAATFEMDEGEKSIEPKKLDFSAYDELPRITLKGAELIECLLRTNTMVISAPLVRKALLDNLGREDIFLPALAGNEDWELWLRGALCGARYEFHSLPETSTLIRTHSTSWSRAGTRMLETWVQMHQLVESEVKDTPYSALNKRQLSFAMLNLMLSQREQGLKKAALKTMQNMRTISGSWLFLTRWIGWMLIRNPIGLKLWIMLKKFKSKMKS